MHTQPVLLEVRDHIAIVTLNDPERLNPLTSSLQDVLMAHLETVRRNGAVRALILTARGKGFCSGADLPELAQWGQGAAHDGGQPSLGQQVGAMMQERGNPLVASLRHLPIPVVCAVNGVVAGGGVGFALSADIVIAARSAYFYLPFVPALGIVPDLGASWLLPRAIGRARAHALTLLGDKLSAEKAEAWGLIWRCVDDEALMDEALQLATRLAALPAHAAMETRALYRASEQHTYEEQLDYERARQSVLIDGPAFAEGLASFLGRRKPVFPGRDSS